MDGHRRQGLAGHLKSAWDQLFSKRPGLTLVLCGSVSSWIEENTGELDPAIEASDYFDHLINADEWVAG